MRVGVVWGMTLASPVATRPGDLHQYSLYVAEFASRKNVECAPTSYLETDKPANLLILESSHRSLESALPSSFCRLIER